MRVCLMIEGQEDVTWEQWVALAEACERTETIEALFRSDHYLSVEGRGGLGSLDAWATVNALATITSRIRLGTLVSPATFRHPSVVAKMAVTADHVSGGRIELGLGAGWLEAEHRAYGFTFEPTRTRMDVLAEQLEIVHRSWKPGPFSFHGEHYRIEDLDALPKPVQQPHPTLLVGGSGGPRSLALAAQWADEYNTPFAAPDRCRELRGRLDDACEKAGREPIPLSVMTRLPSLDDVPGLLEALASAGVARVMLQHLDHGNVETVERLGRELATRVGSKIESRSRPGAASASSVRNSTPVSQARWAFSCTIR
jgi:F420-dependent oxidoreductase-like protein